MNVLRTVVAGLQIMALVLCMTSAVSAEDLAEPRPGPHILIDLDKRSVLSAERETDRWAPASLTKMMTAYTVFRALELQHLAMNSPVRISEYALSQPPSKMGFPIGTILTIDAALKIIMVKSANDVSVALAEAVGGTEEGFVALMNAHARRLGMADSRFSNPHGLHDPDQFTSAYDMARLVIALTDEFPQYRGFFDIPALRVGNRRLRNHNALLRLFEGTNGMKTGYVCASGYNVAVRTKRSGRSLVAVVMGAKRGLARNVKAAKLLADGFSGAFDGEARAYSPRGTSYEGKAAYDITRQICPRKYAALGKPDTRPPEAPSAQDFDGIDTQGLPPARKPQRDDQPITAKPRKRPEFVKSASAVVAAASAAEQPVANAETENVPEDTPPTLQELAGIYLNPVSGLRPEERVTLGGGVGPNPFGVLHTDGGPYKAPIPVPEPRPALDLAEAEE